MIIDTGGVVSNLGQLQAMAAGGNSVTFANGSQLTLNVSWASLAVDDVLFVV